MGRVRYGNKMSGGGVTARNSLSMSNLTAPYIADQYDELYLNVGEIITNIYSVFCDDNNQLADLIDMLNFNNYATLADKFYLSANIDNRTFRKFRHLLIQSIETLKCGNIRAQEQEIAFQKLLDEFNSLTEEKEAITTLFTAEATLDTPLGIKPEISEYVKRGYKLVDDNGIPIVIDMSILAQIRSDLNCV